MTPASSAAPLSPDDWAWASDNLPIVCADVLPVRRDALGRVEFVGLIRRTSPFGPRWCHVGGRVLHGESLEAAAARHVLSTLAGSDSRGLARVPYAVHEYFPEPRSGAGHDPRKHAVAACFTLDVPEDAALEPIGEATDFCWFTVDRVLDLDDRWPGTEPVIARAVSPAGGADATIAYEALNARQVSRDELMWQSPALAMTAMAFLLTIALGDGQAWQRALAALLSAGVAVVSAQLLARHSLHSIDDAEALLTLELRLGLPLIHARPPANPRPARGLEARLARYRSRRWWLYALVSFAVVSAALAVQPLVSMVVAPE
ncbi:DUF4916 domain-containing protein [Cellulomonas oligotrophica]|uniref:ADP-ribose pyrophosphatase YjhB (NUDIX family) n=1 Tax=Cellulomonas oligotrophica TaxID=931536 RepID=A0A7Y9FEJ9_9CELL|nr:DUF4916 domain-containing protein [Cellulomonas oligotrophica]NYD85883.1 ADP-ribose pyrophosphatase YjhB (NUDIX family) [Cellulomonas oligotrophica]GIG31110.1 hypothetical protein Col01nite_02690 [Cellulomonas oligotrophica]